MKLGDRIVRAAGGCVRHVVVANRLDSTQGTAVRLLEQIAAEDVALGTTLIVAREQARGHGRNGREWVSPPGGLYMTWLRTWEGNVSPEMLPILAAAAAVRAVDAVAPGLVGLKWPNDLLVEGAKLGGILVSARRGERPGVAVGLGLNLRTVPGRGAGERFRAACLADHADLGPWEETTATLAGRFATALDAFLDAPDGGLALWRERLIHREGDRMTVRTGDGALLEGTFEGLTREGYLTLRSGASVRTIAAGDVIHWEA